MRLYALLTHNHVFFYLTGLNKERLIEELSKSILKTDKISYKIQIYIELHKFVQDYLFKFV